MKMINGDEPQIDPRKGIRFNPDVLKFNLKRAVASSVPQDATGDELKDYHMIFASVFADCFFTAFRRAVEDNRLPKDFSLDEYAKIFETELRAEYDKGIAKRLQV